MTSGAGYGAKFLLGHRNLYDVMRPALASSYNLAEGDLGRMNFPQLASYADNMMAGVFEGVNMDHNYTTPEIESA
jgi:hypothetical protein